MLLSSNHNAHDAMDPRPKGMQAYPVANKTAASEVPLWQLSCPRVWPVNCVRNALRQPCWSFEPLIARREMHEHGP
jgi:hypothetical protein